MSKAMVTGSFDPVTRGHFALFELAAHCFDEVVVCVFRNPDKSYMFSEEERLQMIRQGLLECGLTNVIADASDGYAADYAKEHGISFVVRGVRTADDMAYELEMARYNQQRNPQMDTLMWATPIDHREISSTAVRTSLKNGVIPEDLLLPSVALEIKKILGL